MTTGSDNKLPVPALSNKNPRLFCMNETLLCLHLHLYETMKQIKSTVTLKFFFFRLLAIDCYRQDEIRKAFAEVVDAVSILFFS
jgi:hypothetical protein